MLNLKLKPEHHKSLSQTLSLCRHHCRDHSIVCSPYYYSI